MVRAEEDDGVLEEPISMAGARFEPLYAAADGPVTWVNDDDQSHTVTATDGSFNSGVLSPGEEFTFEFDEPGSYSYFCAFHSNMVGTITVAGAEPGSGDADADDAMLPASGSVESPQAPGSQAGLIALGALAPVVAAGLLIEARRRLRR